MFTRSSTLTLWNISSIWEAGITIFLCVWVKWWRKRIHCNWTLKKWNHSGEIWHWTLYLRIGKVKAFKKANLIMKSWGNYKRSFHRDQLTYDAEKSSTEKTFWSCSWVFILIWRRTKKRMFVISDRKQNTIVHIRRVDSYNHNQLWRTPPCWFGFK